MKTTIEIDDTLSERIESAIDDVKALFTEYCNSNTPDEAPDLGNDLDYSGSVHEIVDGAVPIYTNELKGLWFLYGSEFEEAYEDAGIGENPMENDGMVAVYCYIDQNVRGHYEDNKDEWFSEWQEANPVKEDEEEEVEA